MEKTKYSLAITSRFKRSFKRFLRDVQERVYEKLVLLLQSPYLGLGEN